ncbi:class I SAM-dependent methyltransferase [Chitinilyticum piscinae]|uniref:Class I SAM-dependent methyltransferase n=1 Tax=Chitinilyticum piscinae TaxID=2866724 RepID=A0A8J7K1Q5_9NEIS|nr:class I SAM-dependent methyltransferase [Chitinilyticum piscinae]MBE9609551.1 class I SAM-dependent methyltransferase [Chitinilyticum piscinae]
MDYYGFVRQEIIPLLPEHAPRALEVGCGNGATLAWLKASGLCREAVGVEYSQSASQIAREHLDLVIEGNAEHIDFGSLGQFDLILCLDVLEHLQDPWLMLRRLRERLSERGVLIVSLPNVRHHSVLLPLLLGGRWHYTDAGILDRTHLRFFTRDTARDLLETSGFAIADSCSVGQNWSPSRWWRWLGKWRAAEPFCAVQYLFAARAS